MTRLAVFAACAAALTAGCVPTMTAAPAGAFQPTGSAMAVDLQSSWTQIPENMNLGTNGSVLTRHGLALERLDILSIENGKPLLPEVRNVDVPLFRSGMSEPELVELVTSSLSRLGFTDLHAENVRAQTLAGAPGVRFNLTGKYGSGLSMRGDVALAESNGVLNAIMFVAPASHYYDAYAPEVDRVIQSARPAPNGRDR